MSFILKPVDTVDTISPKDFRENYLLPRRPLIIKDLTGSWPARDKWNINYFKDIAGDLEVPLYDNSKADPSKPVNSTAARMKMGDYLDLIQSQPTELRIFLFNIFKHRPQLLKDIELPKELMGGIIESMPAMFFGGSNSVTFLHYDIDMPNLLHTHFGGRKHVILFDYKWKRRLYCIPNATYALEDYDVLNPDFEKFPALRGVEGYELFLEHGDTLFMPRAMWHWMKYLNGSFSLTLRAWDESWAQKMESMLSVITCGGIDSVLKMILKAPYARYREKLAIKWAERAMEQGLPK